MINGFMRETAKTTRGYHNWHWEHNTALWIGACGRWKDILALADECSDTYFARGS